MSSVEWIGVDWGTTNLRVFIMGKNEALLTELESDRGMGVLQPSEFEPTLLELIAEWLPQGGSVPIYACGMVGARQGWQEAAYRSVPCYPVSNQGLTAVKTADSRIDVYIIPGLSQQTHADVMRGEETQVGGLLAMQPLFSGTVCLPGTHSKWASIVNGEVSQFQTFMTGELYSLISKRSILRHSLSDDELDKVAFMDAALSAVEKPQSVVSDLFSLRASSLLNDLNPKIARARLSGMIIGQEVGVARSFWDKKPVKKPVALIGASFITSLYTDILYELGVDVRVIDTKMATLSGLSVAANIEKAVQHEA